VTEEGEQQYIIPFFYMIITCVQVLKAVTSGLFMNAAQFDHTECDPRASSDSGSNVYRLLRHMQQGKHHKVPGHIFYIFISSFFKQSWTCCLCICPLLLSPCNAAPGGCLLLLLVLLATLLLRLLPRSCNTAAFLISLLLPPLLLLVVPVLHRPAVEATHSRVVGAGTHNSWSCL
jgi:hypothetical protein